MIICTADVSVLTRWASNILSLPPPVSRAEGGAYFGATFSEHKGKNSLRLHSAFTKWQKGKNQTHVRGLGLPASPDDKYHLCVIALKTPTL